MTTRARKPDFVRALTRLIAEEKRLHELHTDLLREERRSITLLRPERVAELAAERDVVASRLLQIQEQYRGMTVSLGGSNRQRLTDIMQTALHPSDIAELMPVIEDVRQVRERCKQYNEECSSVTGHALRMVSGVLAILRSAAHSVVRTYTRQGVATEAAIPQGSGRGPGFNRSA